jgi:NADPH:quinone reductase-like Zn-dependent oxidoreductase
VGELDVQYQRGAGAAGELAAVPETYATAWTCLFRNLELARGQTPLIGGAAFSFGQAVR